MKNSELKNELLMYRLRADGINASYYDAESLRRSAMRLRRWHERECNGEVWTDEDTGITWKQDPSALMRGIMIEVPNIGKIEESKIRAICNSLGAHYYIQGDPRGASLYVSSSPIDCNINRGVCCDLN